MKDEAYTKDGELIYRVLSREEVDERFNIDYMTTDLFPPSWLVYGTVILTFMYVLLKEAFL